MRKPSAVLRESVLAQRTQTRRQDPETAAMLSNCDLAIDENEGEPPNTAAKKIGKKILNEAFFSSLPKKVDVRSTSSPCSANCLVPLATSTVMNIDRSNARIKRTS